MSEKDLSKILALGLALAGKFAAEALQWVMQKIDSKDPKDPQE